MRRDRLNKLDLYNTMQRLANSEPGLCLITMSIGQWDNILYNAYNASWVLLELDANEKPVAAYQKTRPQ